LETINILEKLSVMFVTPGRTKQPGEFMSGRGECPCARCKEVKRKDKMVQYLENQFDNVWLCKHCKAVMIYKLRELEKVALLSD